MEVRVSMCNLAVCGGLWRHLAPKLGPRQARCGQHGLARTPSKSSKPKNVVKLQVFSVSHWVRKIGPGWALGSRWSPSWSQLAPKRSRWTPTWSHVMHTEVQVTFKVAQLATLWRQRGTNRDTTWGTLLRTKRQNSSENERLDDFGLASYVLHFEAIWLQLGPKLLSNGSKLGPSCAILEPSCAILEPSWAEVGANWVQVGPKLGPCWPKLAPSQVNVADMLDRNSAFGRFWSDLQNVQITKAGNRLLAARPGEHAPPDETVPVWKICPVASAPKLSRLRIFGAGGFDLIYLLYYIILYYILLYYIILYFTILYFIILYNIILYYTFLKLYYSWLYYGVFYFMSYHIMSYFIILFYFIYVEIVLYYPVFFPIIYITCHIISFHILSFYIISHCIILYYTVLYFIILFYIVLYCKILQNIVLCWFMLY